MVYDHRQTFPGSSCYRAYAPLVIDAVGRQQQVHLDLFLQGSCMKIQYCHEFDVDSSPGLLGPLPYKMEGIRSLPRVGRPGTFQY